MNKDLYLKILMNYDSIADYCRKQGFSRQYLYSELKVKRPRFVARIAKSLGIKEHEIKKFF